MGGTILRLYPSYRGSLVSLTFEPLAIEGVWRITPTPFVDDRGEFSRIFCADDFSSYGLNTNWRQVSSSLNYKKGTLRGPHFQFDPYSEIKLVTCSRGAVFDVVVDLRLESKTFGSYVSLELSEINSSFVYVPKGCAHGFMSLEDATLINYFISEDYNLGSSSGIFWGDEDVKIAWPIDPVMVSDKDEKLPSLNELRVLLGNSELR